MKSLTYLALIGSISAGELQDLGSALFYGGATEPKECFTQPAEEGGKGVIEPNCAADPAKSCGYMLQQKGDDDLEGFICVPKEACGEKGKGNVGKWGGLNVGMACAEGGFEALSVEVGAFVKKNEFTATLDAQMKALGDVPAANYLFNTETKAISYTTAVGVPVTKTVLSTVSYDEKAGQAAGQAAGQDAGQDAGAGQNNAGGGNKAPPSKGGNKAPPSKGGKKPEGDGGDKSGSGGDGQTNDSNEEKKDTAATSKEGERGVRAKKAKCLSKGVGTGCVEKMCCMLATSVDFAGMEAYKAMDDTKKKELDDKTKTDTDANKAAGKGVCWDEDATEIKGEDINAKSKGVIMKGECGATALATSALAVVAALSTM